MALPNKLLSETTSQAFKNCSVCDADLKNQLYFLEKAYHRNLSDNQHSVIFEYAICESCKREMIQKVSNESMLNMQNFMLKHQKDIDEMMSVEIDLAHCTFTGKPLAEIEEYHVVAVIKDNELQMSPVIFGDEMMEKYQEVLSKETKDFFKDFYDKFINIPPALAKILGKDIKPVLL